MSEKQEKKEPLKQKAYHIIKDKIISCEYPPNYLLNEEKLREEIQASRTPIRDALSRLEQEKLVRILPKKGIMVASLSIREINAIYETRMLIETYVVEHYANKVPREHLERYRDTFRRMIDEVGDGERYYDIDNQLHQEFINASENDYFAMAYERIFCQNCRLRILSGVRSENRIRETQEEHLEIVECCLEKEWVKAREAMKTHLIKSKKASFETMFADQDMAI